MLRHSSGRVPAEFLTKIINIKDGSERFERAQSKEGEASPTKKSSRHRNTPRETFGHQSKDQERLKTRSLGENLSTAEILEENNDSEVYAQCNYCFKRSRKGTIFRRCAQKFGGQSDLQEKRVPN